MQSRILQSGVNGVVPHVHCSHVFQNADAGFAFISHIFWLNRDR